MKEDKIARNFELMEEFSQRLLRQLHQEIGMKNLGVTGSQYMVLKKIDARGRMTVSGVAEDLAVSLSAVTAQVDRLCRGGFATRRRDEKDRRVVWLELTGRGREVVEACDAAQQRVLKKYFDRLDEEDLDRLLEIKTKLIQILREEERDQ